MALVVKPEDSRLQIRFDMGTDPNGRRIVRTRTFTRVKSNAVVQDIFDVAQALAALQTHDVVSVTRVDQSELASE